MIRVHLGTGMRPSELCRIKPCDIDRSGDVWVYRPTKHKTANRGKVKAVPILGDAREALTDYLNRSPESFCFSPAEAVAYWQAEKRTARKSKVQPSQQSRAVASPRKVPGDHYTPHSYRQSIQRAAKRAGVEKWHPEVWGGWSAMATLTRLGIRLSARTRVILVDATKIENGQGNLQCNECIGIVMPSPSDPEDIAEKE